jgi:hypothetical protein
MTADRMLLLTEVSFHANKKQISEKAVFGNNIPVMGEINRCCQLCSNKVTGNHTEYTEKGCVEPRLLKFVRK